MKITFRSSLAEVAGAVGNALRQADIRAVLTGGGCATIYSEGEYLSEDLDFVVQGAASLQRLDQAMAGVGFERRGDQYFHSKSRFFIEFPPGPLGIGRDVEIRPIELRVGDGRVLALSPTDSARDRLASFFFWNDRQSLEVAVAIALRKQVDLDAIEKWATEEGAKERFREFQGELQKRKRSLGRKPGSRSGRR